MMSALARTVGAFAAVAAASAAQAGPPLPVLPTMWTATVSEAQVGVVLESENNVYNNPTDSNPSAKWTNFTDGSCSRLIHFSGARGTCGAAWFRF